MAVNGIISPGTLWSRVAATSDRAIACGDLVPLSTSHELIDGGECRFQVRVLENLSRKAEARFAELDGTVPPAVANPFLPPDPCLLVGAVSPTHLAVLNKYNVLKHHLLIVTRRFEEQEALLTRADLESLWSCLLEADALGFYNGGAAAGASQRHKHLQLIPLPLHSELPELPMELLLRHADDHDGIWTSSALPFFHAARPVGVRGDPTVTAAVLHRTYIELGLAIGILDGRHPDGAQRSPYNLLLTRRWMMLVPRSREFFERISVNALGFAGGLMVREHADLERIRALGPLAILRHVGKDRQR